MRRTAAFAIAAVLALSAPAARGATSATIVSHEEEKYFFEGGRMSRFEGQFEHTYFLDNVKGVLVRTRTYDYRAKRITPDETVYRIERSLHSDPTNSDRYSLTPVIRAIGVPDGDHVETLTVTDKEVVSSLAAPGKLILSRSRRLK